MYPYNECKCGGMFIEEIEDNIVTSIMKLNHKGYKTKFCCGGHADQHSVNGGTNIYISFAERYNFTESPEGFKMSKNKGPENISYDTFTKKEKKLIQGVPIELVIKKKIDAINEWIDRLPEGPDKPPYKHHWKNEIDRLTHINRILDNTNLETEVVNMPQEQHECDLFLMSSNNSYHANNSLADFARLGSRNINGWGIGFYQDGRSRVVKSELRAVEDGNINNTFAKVSEVVSSNIILGHLRFTSRGSNIPQNNHPFQLKFLDYDWLLIHNGSVSSGINLVPLERQLLLDSNSDSPRVFEFLRERIIDYMMSEPKRSLIEACRTAYGKLLDKDENGTYNVILSNGYLSFIFIHWRPFYLLHREKEAGDTAIISTIRLNQREEWIEFKKLGSKRAKMLVFCGPTLILNGDVD
jgi:predicted glutamine amidotransferase